MSRFHITLILALLLAAVALFLGSHFLFATAIIALIFRVGLGVTIPQMNFFGPFICRGDNSQRRVALTFDDGPDARSTPALLDVLRDEKIKATFFCIGKNVVKDRELAARIVREGHLLGNHTFNHSNATNFFTAAHLRDDLAQTQAAIQNAAGIVPTWFRPPMGLSNPRTFRVAQALELKVIGWSARTTAISWKGFPKSVAAIRYFYALQTRPWLPVCIT